MDLLLKNQIKEKIMPLRNVIGYSEDEQPRIKGGIVIKGTKVIRVYVTKKESKLSLMLKGVKIPKSIGNIETDVVEIGEIKLLQTPPTIRKAKNAGLIGGISIGHKDITAGTFARVAWLNKKPYFLTNNHVAANSALDSGEGGKIGDLEYQPGPYDIVSELGGVVSDKYLVGSLAEFAPLSAVKPNFVDAALIAPTVSVDSRGWFNYVQLDLPFIPAPSAVKAPEVGMQVAKSGRTTGVTYGVISDTNATLQISGYHDKTLTFEKQIFITPLSPPFVQGGDSGSLLLETTNDEGISMVGLIFAGSNTIGVANRMDEVERAFSSPLMWNGPFFWEAGKEYVSDAPVEPLPPTPSGEVYYLPVQKEVTIVVNQPKIYKGSSLLMNPNEEILTGELFVVSGKLIDTASGLPIAGKTIYMDDVISNTNSEGDFSFMHPSYSLAGSYLIVISFLGD